MFLENHIVYLVKGFMRFLENKGTKFKMANLSNVSATRATQFSCDSSLDLHGSQKKDINVHTDYKHIL